MKGPGLILGLHAMDFGVLVDTRPGSPPSRTRLVDSQVYFSSLRRVMVFCADALRPSGSVVTDWIRRRLPSRVQIPVAKAAFAVEYPRVNIPFMGPANDFSSLELAAVFGIGFEAASQKVLFVAHLQVVCTSASDVLSFHEPTIHSNSCKRPEGEGSAGATLSVRCAIRHLPSRLTWMAR